MFRQKSVCTLMFIAAFIINTKTWKQPNVLQLVNEWTNSGKSIQFQYNSYIPILSNKEWTSDTLDNIDVSQVHFAKWKCKKPGYKWFHLYDILEKTELQEQKNRSVILRGLGWRKVDCIVEAREKFGVG